MAPIESVFTENAPKPLPQFSQAIKHNGTVYCSGNIGLDPKTGKIVDGTIKDRTIQALTNLSAVLEAAGSSFRNVVKINVFLISMADFGTMNEGYDSVINWETKPCRTCVAVKELPFGTDVEIECIAVLDPSPRL